MLIYKFNFDEIELSSNFQLQFFILKDQQTQCNGPLTTFRILHNLKGVDKNVFKRLGRIN